MQKALHEISKDRTTIVIAHRLSTVRNADNIFVLGNKVKKFGDFVNQNQWRTLSRMAQIMKAKMSPGKIKRPGFFSYEKLERWQNHFTYKKAIGSFLKTIWITGGSSGIGAATAKKFNENNWQVIISSRNYNKLNKIADFQKILL